MAQNCILKASKLQFKSGFLHFWSTIFCPDIIEVHTFDFFFWIILYFCYIRKAKIFMCLCRLVEIFPVESLKNHFWFSAPVKFGVFVGWSKFFGKSIKPVKWFEYPKKEQILMVHFWNFQSLFDVLIQNNGS